MAEIKTQLKNLALRFKADNHGADYLMRAVSSWLAAVCVCYLLNGGIFDKNYAVPFTLFITALFAAGAYLVLSALRFIPRIKAMRTDAAALLCISAAFAILSCLMGFYKNGSNITVFAGVAPFFALAVRYTTGKYRLKLPVLAKKLYIGVIILSAVFMLTFTGITMIYRYFNLYTPAFDFGIFAQMFENMKDGTGAVTTLERGYALSHFAVHFSPAYYLLLPFYMIYPHPVTLQLLQGIVVTSGILPVFLIARKYGFSKLHCSLICAVYALYPAMTGACSYDIHENCMLPALLLWTIYGIEKEKTVFACIFAFLTLTVKEDAAVYIAVIGLYLLFSDRSKKIRITGAGMLLGAIAYFIGVCAYLESFGLGVMDWRYSQYIPDGGAGLMSVIMTFISNPAYVLSNLFTGDKAVFALQMLAPLGFLPLVSKKIFRYILLIPFVLVNLMPDYQYQHSLFFQYVFATGTLMIWLFIMNMSQLKYNTARSMTVFSLVACGMMFVSTMTGMLNNFTIHESEIKAATIEYLEALPESEDESITASTFFTPALYKQKELYTISDSKTPNSDSAPPADTVLLDRNSSCFDINYAYYINLGMKEVPVEGDASKRICRLEFADTQ